MCFSKQETFLPPRKLEGVHPLNLARYIYFFVFSRGKPGSKTFVAKRFLPKGAKEKEGVTVKEVNTGYFWTPLAGIDFSVGVAVPVSHGEDQLISLTIPAG